MSYEIEKRYNRYKPYSGRFTLHDKRPYIHECWGIGIRSLRGVPRGDSTNARL